MATCFSLVFIIVLIISSVMLVGSLKPLTRGRLQYRSRNVFSSLIPEVPATPRPAPPSDIKISDRLSPELIQPLIDKHFPKAQYRTEDVTRVVEARQLNHSSDAFAVPKQTCKYGYPQAIVALPIGRTNSSGMVRLTCPHLVKEIDKLETTYIPYFNNLLESNTEKGQALRDELFRLNKVWKNIRNDSVTDEERKDLLATPAGPHLLNSGIIGISLDKLNDVKCLHAQVADHIIRDDNQFGNETLEILETSGVDTKGCADCWQQCNPAHNTSGWWYVPQKNKQRLRLRKERRSQHNRAIREKALASEKFND